MLASRHSSSSGVTLAAVLAEHAIVPSSRPTCNGTDKPVASGRAIPTSGLDFDAFATALFFLVVACTACLMPAQSDTWWQLRAGQDIVERGLELRETFSHTQAGGYWPNHEWLSQFIFYRLYEAGGLPLLTAFAAALVTLSWWIVWQLTPGRATVKLVLSAVAMTAFAREWSLRPQVFTLFFLAVTAFCLVRGRYWVLPIVFAAWANLHGGVTLGIGLMMSAAFVAVLSERRVLIPAVVWTVVCAALTGLTPLGYSLWTEVPASLSRLDDYGVIEWRAPSLTDPSLAPFWLLVGLFAVLIIVHKPWNVMRSGRDTIVLLWAVAFLPIALSASRNIPALLIVLVPAIGTLRALQPARPAARARRERPMLNLGIVGASATAALLAVAVAWNREIPRLQWNPLPAGAIAAVESCPGRIYNRYDEGGYLIWFTRGQRVFIDSRQDPYPREFVREHLRVEASGDFEETFRRYDIRCAFLPVQSTVAQQLMARQWNAGYRDPTWVVLTEPNGRNSR